VENKVTVQGYIVVSGAVTGQIYITLPVAAQTLTYPTSQLYHAVGTAVMTPAGTVYTGRVCIVNNTTLKASVFAEGGGGTYNGLIVPTATVPGVWASTNDITFNFTYECIN
jgi:hypothetical protein